LGLRYAPLIKEVHRPLLLRFLVEQGVETEELRTREPMRIVKMRPPPFMGPPDRGPLGSMTKPPTSLPEPQQLITTLDAGNGLVGFARPTLMGPPKGMPSGSTAEVAPPQAPRAPPPPSETSKLVSREMVAPQKLATMSQLLRRVAVATDELHAAPPRDILDDTFFEDPSAGPVDVGALAKMALLKTPESGKTSGGSHKSLPSGGSSKAERKKKGKRR
jgi:hypothetical protein